MKRIKKTRRILEEASKVDDVLGMIFMMKFLVITVISLLRLLKKAGLEEEAYARIGKDARGIFYED